MWRVSAIALIWILLVLCVGITWYVWFRMVATFLIGGAGPGINLLIGPLFFIMWGTPIIAPSAGVAALYLCKSPRFPYLAIAPVMLMAASAVYSTKWLP